jgi:hypothetical protein
VRIKEPPHHRTLPLNLKNHKNHAAVAPPAQGVDPQVIPFLDVLAELGARAVLRELAPRDRYKVHIRPKRVNDKPKFSLKRLRICQT